ncbi:LysR substrate-binding domain-containing protein [uncultured Roseovarius sp.]|uniref:LysR substrate-binding domain-containing protein n=1 Tax=uncultured Roseovarius sp. TaxID=293344 RepID=UPI002605F896|nr:LysR substrate-binding domain-containing protein [uncultured Roseovarius sp.]
MNIRQVEIFQKVMSSGSVTKAARLLNISQPAVSKHLKLMEYDVGFVLFERKGNQLEPTSEALALFEQVDQIYTGMEALSRFAGDLRDNQLGDLSVAAMPLLAQRWLPSVVGKFAKEHPTVSLSVPVRSTDWVARAVAAGRADIGLGLERSNDHGVISEPLMRLPLVAVFEQGHALSSDAALKFSDLVGHDLITLSNFDRWPLKLNDILASNRVRPTRCLEVFTAHIACELALHGAGVAIVDLMTALDFQDKGLSIRTLDTDISFQIMLLRPKHRRETRVASSLKEEIIEAAQTTEKQILNFLG